MVGVQRGKVLSVAAPYDRLSGQGALIGAALFGVACHDVLSGVVGEFMTEEVVSLAKTSAQAWSKGDRIAWDNTNKRLDSDLSKGPCVGVCVEDAANPSSTGKIKLAECPAPRANTVAVESSPAPASDATAGNATLTAAQMLAGVFVRDPNGASRTDTLPTAALLVAAVPGAKVGDMIRCYIVNGADAAEVLTIQAGAGGGFDANQTAASRVLGQNTSKMLHLRLTNVTPAAEAYVAYL
jgi:predicted RecA/RadA family phage recombinase